MPKTTIVNYKIRITPECDKAIKKKSESEFRTQNSVVKEILEKWARKNG